jgi:lipid-binding SYLF domain-containing protein
MKARLSIFLVFMLTIKVGTLMAAPLNEDDKSAENHKAIIALEEVIMTLGNVMENPVNGFPQNLINKSEAIMIFPATCNVAVGAFNGWGGKGIAIIRNEDSSWSNPFFVTLAMGSPGFQISSQASDIVLFYKNRDDVINIDKEPITLGVNAGVAEGPVNKESSMSTDFTFKTEIYSYHWSNGSFNGISLKGGIISYYEKFSNSLYGMNEINTDEICYRIDTPYNDKVNDLIVALNVYDK